MPQQIKVLLCLLSLAQCFALSVESQWISLWDQRIYITKELESHQFLLVKSNLALKQICHWTTQKCHFHFEGDVLNRTTRKSIKQMTFPPRTIISYQHNHEASHSLFGELLLIMESPSGETNVFELRSPLAGITTAKKKCLEKLKVGTMFTD